MHASITTATEPQRDPLDRYVSAVHSLHAKLARISSNQHASAASLGRAAAALRALADLGKPKTAPDIGK